MDTPKKQKIWKSFSFGENVVNISKKIPESKVSRNVNGQSHNFKEKSFDFDSKFEPKQISELAVHPKKLRDLQDCLLEILSKTDTNHPQFVLLSGPSGSGKSVSLKVICRELGIAVDEWINPIDQDFEITRENQLSQFVDFLIGSKWVSLFQKDNNHITIVKDFPNALLRQPDKFKGVLEECWYRTKSVIVFVCTEMHNNNNYNKMFSDDILREYKIRQIEFNACASTLLRNAVKRAQTLIKNHSDLFTQPSSTVVDAIIATSMGDIRNAMNQFYLSSLKGGGDVPVDNEKFKKINDGKRKKRTNKDVRISSMQRDENLGLFHGLGRVLNPKWKEDAVYKKLNCDLGKLIDEFSAQPGIFVSFLFENYVKYYGDFNDASKAAEILSVSAQFLENFGDRYEIVLYGLWISVLGLMVNNKHKVSKWTQIRKPIRTQKKNISDTKLFGYDASDIFYYNLIKKSVGFENNPLNVTNVDFESDEITIEDDD